MTRDTIDFSAKRSFFLDEASGRSIEVFSRIYLAFGAMVFIVILWISRDNLLPVLIGSGVVAALVFEVNRQAKADRAAGRSRAPVEWENGVLSIPNPRRRPGGLPAIRAFKKIRGEDITAVIRKPNVSYVVANGRRTALFRWQDEHGMSIEDFLETWIAHNS